MALLYDNGVQNDQSGIELTQGVQYEDFVIASPANYQIDEVEVWCLINLDLEGVFLGEFHWEIRTSVPDGTWGEAPGVLLADGMAVPFETELLNTIGLPVMTPLYDYRVIRYKFAVDSGTLTGGVKYWLGLHNGDKDGGGRLEFFWETTNVNGTQQGLYDLIEFDVYGNTPPWFGSGQEHAFKLYGAEVEGNTPPVITEVGFEELEGEGACTTDALIAAVVAEDADEDELTFTYEWSRNGDVVEGQTEVEYTGPQTPGDEICVTVVANDGTDDSDPVTACVQIADCTLQEPCPEWDVLTDPRQIVLLLIDDTLQDVKPAYRADNIPFTPFPLSEAIPPWVYDTGYLVHDRLSLLRGIYLEACGTIDVEVFTSSDEAFTHWSSVPAGQHYLPVPASLAGYKHRVRVRAAKCTCLLKMQLDVVPVGGDSR